MKSIQEIIKIVADETGISVKDILNNSRKENIVFARHLSMWACKWFTEESLQKIANEHNRNNHGTVINACQSIRHMSSYNESIKDACNRIKLKIQ